jgi:exodeoxyribonuclease VII large subunit
MLQVLATYGVSCPGSPLPGDACRADDPPVSTRAILTPSQLNALARSLLEDSFRLVEVEGELSNLSRPASGHLYFALKDRNALVRCALFKPKSTWLRFKPADGQQVIARGRVTLYEPRGDYQLLVEHLEPAGEGALQRAFEELKQRLAAEGLFAAERKRPLPAWVRRLGVITSPRGAAIHDVLSVLKRRFPLLEVELLPVPVQGDGAAALIRAMLERADASGRYDALLLTRGGGSLEDLQAFNDEPLARAIAACRTPVVCAVGHEVDFSIAEFAADLRAPTPSAAAEALSPDRVELLSRLRDLQQRTQACRRRQQQTLAQRLDQVYLRLRAQRPAARLQREGVRLAGLLDRLASQQRLRLQRLHSRHATLGVRLRAQHPLRRLEAIRLRMQAARRRLSPLIALRVQRDARALAALARALNAVSPLATLSRGYAIATAADGRVLRSVGQAKPGDALEVRLADGRIDAEVRAIRPAPRD